MKKYQLAPARSVGLWSADLEAVNSNPRSYF